MKKTFGNLSANFLSREEIKNIKGGNTGYEMVDGGAGTIADCSVTCRDGHKISMTGCSSCSATDPSGAFDGSITCNNSTTYC